MAYSLFSKESYDLQYKFLSTSKIFLLGEGEGGLQTRHLLPFSPVPNKVTEKLPVSKNHNIVTEVVTTICADLTEQLLEHFCGPLNSRYYDAQSLRKKSESRSDLTENK